MSTIKELLSAMIDKINGNEDKIDNIKGVPDAFDSIAMTNGTEVANLTMSADKELLLDGEAINGVASWTDLENKPFYSEVTETVTNVLEWDGNTDGLVAVEVGPGAVLYKVSDIVLESSDFINAIITAIQDNGAEITETITEDTIMSSETSFGLGEIGGIVVVKEDNAEFYNYTFPESGIYFLKVDQDITFTKFELTSGTTFTVISEVVHRMDAKYLPESVATKAYVEEAVVNAGGTGGNASNIVDSESEGSLKTVGCIDEIYSDDYEYKKYGKYSFSQGHNSRAYGEASHAEGENTRAVGPASHAEGYNTLANFSYTHAEGDSTVASGKGTHAEGYNTQAHGEYSHAEGVGTKAYSSNQHVQGKYNTIDNGAKYAHIVGNGTSDSTRSNAHTVDWNGNAWFKGTIYLGGNAQDHVDAINLLTTIQDLTARIAELEAKA